MSVETPPAAAPKSNPAQRIGGVIVAPDGTLREIAARPDWVVPLILILLVSILTNILGSPHVDFETSVRESLEDRNLSPDEIEQGLEFSRIIQKFLIPLTILMVPLSLLILAAATWLAFRVMGGEGTFRQSWAIALYAWIPQLIKMLIVTLLILRAGTVTMEEVQTILKSHPGALVDPSEQPMMFAFLSSLEIFNIWTLVLLGIGFSYAHLTSRARAFTIVLVLWVVVVLGKIGLAALQGIGGPN